MNSPLSQSVRIAAELRQRLATEFNLAEDDEAIDDTVSGEVDLPEQIAGLAREALTAEAYAEGMGPLIKAYQDRKKRLEAKAAKLRAMISWAIQEAGYTKPIRQPDMSIGLSPGRLPLILTGDIPKEYVRVHVEPDKIKIRAALDAGEELGFAKFGNASPVLKISRG